ncbi:MAG: SWIM zinc finger family protein [Acidobacteriota bacterium]
MSRRDRDDSLFPPSLPRRVRGGIRSRSQGGRSWWARRFLEAMAGSPIGGRMARGKSYATHGQTTAIDVGKGRVSARVQGSRPKPYDVEIRLRTIPEATWRSISAALAGRAMLAAELLSGQMPEEIEEVFADLHAPLFPIDAADLATQCSCPDEANPCKHIVAVLFLLAEELDRDPFLLLKLRGKERDELLALMAPGGAAVAQRDEAVARPATAALDADPRSFWHGRELPVDFHGKVEMARSPAALVRRLGPFPFWRSEASIADALAPTYELAAGRGLDLFLRATSRRSDPHEIGPVKP